MRACVCVYVTGKADRGPRLLVTTLHLFRWPIDILGRVGAQEPITDNVRINLKKKSWVDDIYRLAFDGSRTRRRRRWCCEGESESSNIASTFYFSN